MRPELVSSPRLLRLARGSSAPPPVPEERCELCSEAIAAGHRHLLDVPKRELLCACRACTVLFDRRVAGGGHYRLVPDRYRPLTGVDLDDTLWAALGIPVAVAFFVRDSGEGDVVGFYPSPMGPTRAALDLGRWREVAGRNSVLATLEPDVEALLVNRANGAREHWIVPLDACYALVGLVRRTWKGFTGGDAVWGEIAAFFDDLRAKGETP